MIDPKELRIGSHVMVDGVRARVIRIDEPMENEIPPCTLLRFKAIVDGEVRDCGGSADSDKIQPIPITPELLTELGFECRGFAYLQHWFKGGFDIERKNGSSYFDFGSEIRIEYLHELETLYYLIYGKELIKD